MFGHANIQNDILYGIGKVYLSGSKEVILVSESTLTENKQTTDEEGIVIPFERIAPDTLNRMIEEFVTREWSSLSDDGYSLDDKVRQVLVQLQSGKVLLVFDIVTESANIVAVE